MINSSYILLPSKRFYLPFDFYKPQNEYFNIVKNIVDPENWYIIRDRIYISCFPKKGPLPTHGWKIHISGTIWDSEEILEKVSRFCMEHSISFKCLMDKVVFDANQNKVADRSGSGKFITIYPESEKQFIEVTPKLYKLLSMYNGPYILTDRRYGDKGIVYYRYGGINIGLVKLGNQYVHMIKSENGEEFIDDRKPRFQLPNWVKDPFQKNNFNKEKKNNFLLNNRYKVLSVLRYTNAGGTYIAEDIQNAEKVIVKEVRPFTVQYGNRKDAVSLKKTEYAILKKIHSLGVSPIPIDIFKEWEHTYLVESYIDGPTIKQFVVNENPFSKPNSTVNDFNEYFKKIVKIFTNILKTFETIHKNNIVVGDIGPENIILKDNLNPIIIDFDTSLDLDTTDEKHIFGTIGFHNKFNKPDDFKRDYIGIGYLLFYMISPSNNLSELDEHFYKHFLSYLEKQYNLPSQFKEVIEKLIEGDTIQPAEDYISIINDINPNFSETQIREVNISEIEEIIRKVSNFILNSKLDGETQVFPADYLATEYLSIANGTAGILRALEYCDIKIDSAMYNVFKKQVKQNMFQSQLGLHYGLSGICWYLLENNEVFIAREILSYISENLEDIRELNIGEGLAGVGLLFLKANLILKEDDYLKTALTIGDKITEDQRDNVNNIQQIGYESGKSGISLFLLYLSLVSKEEKYINFGTELLKEEIGKGIEINDGYGYPANLTNKNIVYPYLARGTAGIAAVALRYQTVLQDNVFLEQEIEKITNGLLCKLSVDIGLFNGLSGIVSTLIDFYQFTKEVKYYNFACELINNMKQFLLKENEDELACPGSLMYRLSCDYSTGAAGFIMLLKRTLSNKGNPHFFLDELLLDGDLEYPYNVKRLDKLVVK
ncbi:hypothetical protein G3A_00690 [Bacillus sp. 17376]|nr:hypothetical protein G3A_00690 [Bacillus sp. 17376]